MEIKKIHFLEITGSYYISIPKTYIKEGKLDPNKSYRIILEELE